jgi:hypothetical protein
MATAKIITTRIESSTIRFVIFTVILTVGVGDLKICWLAAARLL